jgi:RNA recognition motif-containing protein
VSCGGVQELSDLFKDHGEVVSAVIIKDTMDRSKGYGFVEVSFFLTMISLR